MTGLKFGIAERSTFGVQDGSTKLNPQYKQIDEKAPEAVALKSKPLTKIKYQVNEDVEAP